MMMVVRMSGILVLVLMLVTMVMPAALFTIARTMIVHMMIVSAVNLNLAV